MSALRPKNSHVYIGGKGGEFRGVIEGIHVSSSFNNEMITRNPSMVGDKTVSLYRFEEPISPLSGVYTISSIDSTYTDAGLTENDLTAITIPSADAQSLANALTGKTITDTYVDFTVSPYSTGNYSVIDRYSTPAQLPIISCLTFLTIFSSILAQSIKTQRNQTVNHLSVCVCTVLTSHRVSCWYQVFT